MNEIYLPTVLAAAAKLPGGICDINARKAMADLGFTPAQFRREKRADGIWLVAVGPEVRGQKSEVGNSGDRNAAAVDLPAAGMEDRSA